MQFRSHFVYGILAVIFGMTSLVGSDISLYAVPNPPFSFRDKGAIKGLSIDLLEASLVSLRPQFSQEEIEFDAWNKMYDEALKHPKSYLVTAVKLKEREPHFYWLGPVATVKLAVITKRGTDLPKGKTTLDILRPLRIATIKETSSEKLLFQEIGEKHGLNITRVSTPIQGYKMLEYGRVDALVYTDVPFVYHLISENQDVAQYRLAHVILNTDYYICVGKEIPKEQINIMQAQLNRLKEPDGKGSSLYERIVSRYLKGAVLQP
ncbi:MULTISPECIES: transporter substrate-binding domain-containing protein [unclassified Sulfurospirillum]|uniref:substrate-binding periplasmic protein n=1 Tax=unclassified Sulfurospirillum TaxID=2618290 RepID=UPI0025E4646D|nr:MULTISPECIES: transporter substrate-binding domain-containing protein [unclassified Sulfurospirillum]